MRAGYEVDTILLLDIAGQLTPRSAPGETVEETEEDLRANGDISGIDSQGDDGKHFFTATFRCSRRGGSATTTQVRFSATYGILFSYKGKAVKETAREIARSLAWSRFIDLFSITNGQMRARMPPLPIQLDEIDDQESVIEGETVSPPKEAE
jgi:hypothetical protein